MFTKNIKDTFTANLLNAVSGVLGEAKKKKCSEGCECDACVPEEDTNEGYMPTNDMPSAKDRKTAGKLGNLLKREREAKEKKEPNGVKTEAADMPFEKPYKKVGERKDEYGNKVKNVAKHLAKKAMNKAAVNEGAMMDHLFKIKHKHLETGETKEAHIRARDAAEARNAIEGHYGHSKQDWKYLGTKQVAEEVEEIEEKRGLWDNIHAKRKRIKAGSGERMRKPGSEGAPSAADLKASQKESVDEAFEQIDEISKATMGRYINKAKDSIDTASYRQGHKEAHGSSSKALEKKLSKRHKGIETAVKKLTKEDAEQIDELSKDTMGRYIKKAATKIGTQGVTAGLKIAKDERSQKNFDTIGKRERGISTAVKKLTKEEQDFIDSLNTTDMEQIDEISKGTAMKALQHASSDPDDVRGYTLQKKIGKKWPEMKGHAADASYTAGYGRSGKNIFQDRDKLADRAKTSYRMTKDGKANKQDLKARFRKEEVELDEARGRPKKAGARDFTIHPKTKEKLMHNNPADMARIERLQKNGILQKPKTEANQHVIQQLQRAKLSMRGGETVNFTHGDPTHVSGTHASKLLDKYAGMKPDEKEAFQKKIGHSHANLKSEL